MGDFWLVLQFSWVPFAGAACYALTAAPLGAALSLRDEILLGLALPPVGAAAIVLAVMLGVDPDSSAPLYFSAVAAILAVSLMLPGPRAQGGSVRWRAVLLAGVFCAGEAATLLMGAASPRVEAHVHDMLRGEILAMDARELWGFVILTAVAIAVAFRNRGLLYALALDQEGLVIKLKKRGDRAVLGFRVASALVIAAGVIWVGPLLTLGLLAVPTLLWERRARRLNNLMTGVTAIGFLGVVLGFCVAILLDMPPVPVVIAALFAVGGAAAVACCRRG
ncbi:MAG: metal ABC transporter permease [Candidatus Krumholzibacteriia bacterium]